jgi:hypothetical protein
MTAQTEPLANLTHKGGTSVLACGRTKPRLARRWEAEIAVKPLMRVCAAGALSASLQSQLKHMQPLDEKLGPQIDLLLSCAGSPVPSKPCKNG